MSKTLQEEATEAYDALMDLFNEITKVLRLREAYKWLDDKLKWFNK